MAAGPGAVLGSNDDLSYMYSKMCNELEQHLKACSQQHSASPLFGAMKQLCDNVVYAKQSRELMAAVALLQKTVESLLNGLMLSPNESQEMVLRFRDCHLLVLKGLQVRVGFVTPLISEAEAFFGRFISDTILLVGLRILRIVFVLFLSIVMRIETAECAIILA